MAGTAQTARPWGDARGGTARFGHRRRNRPVCRDPIGRAVIEYDIERARRTRRRGDRAHRYCIRRRTQWRPDLAAVRVGDQPSRSDRHVGGAASIARRLFLPAVHHRWRPRFLRPRFGRPVPPRGELRRSHPQGREAGRPPGAGADQVRAGHQPQDRGGARPQRAGHAARPRRRGDRMKRRAFIGLLGAAATWPLAVRAQQQDRMRRIGVLMPQAESDPEQRSWTTAFATRLRELGWRQGENAQIDYRWLGGDTTRAASLAKELVDLQPDVILAATNTPAVALRQYTLAIPIAFTPV